MFPTTTSKRSESFQVAPLDRALIDDCITTLEPSEYSSKTLSKYELMLLEWAEWLQAKSVCVLDAKPKHVKQFMAYLHGEGRVGVDRQRPPEQRLGWHDNLAASTRKGYFAAIRTLYKHLVIDEQTNGDQRRSASYKSHLTAVASPRRSRACFPDLEHRAVSCSNRKRRASACSQQRSG